MDTEGTVLEGNSLEGPSCLLVLQLNEINRTKSLVNWKLLLMCTFSGPQHDLRAPWYAIGTIHFFGHVLGGNEGNPQNIR